MYENRNTLKVKRGEEEEGKEQEKEEGCVSNKALTVMDSCTCNERTEPTEKAVTADTTNGQTRVYGSPIDTN